MTRYCFSKEWFDEHISVWERLLQPLQGTSVRALEIGVFEGCSTVWLLENILVHPHARLIAVDTFEGGMENKHWHPHLLDGLEERFLANIAATGQGDQVETIKRDSFGALVGLHAKACEPFDLIYIDGSHRACDVLADAALSWPLLKSGGILIFDDYLWDVFPEPHHNPRVAIDAFLISYAPQYELLHSDYQVAVRKCPSNIS
ncbi:MAG: class I SAM-dependent methyltransferase [Parachlamydiales bacterium]